MWTIYDASGNKQSIPPDSFVFWATLCEGTLYSDQTQSQVFWCANSNTCFGATMMDTDTWKDMHGSTISGQWRVTPQTSGTNTQLRIQFLKQMNVDMYPSIRGPQWLLQRGI
jgi:hypothetical protein